MENQKKTFQQRVQEAIENGLPIPIATPEDLRSELIQGKAQDSDKLVFRSKKHESKKNIVRPHQEEQTSISDRLKALKAKLNKVNTKIDKQLAIEQQKKALVKPQASLPFMTYEKARVAVGKIINRKMKEEGCVYSLNWKTKKNPTKNLAFVLENLTKYFIKDDSCIYDLNKSIWLHGRVGTGKTFILEVFEEFTKKFNLPTAFSTVPTQKLVDQVELYGIQKLHEYKRKKWCYDDLCEEEVKIQAGERWSKKNCMENILFHLYHQFKASGKTSLVTSNFVPLSKAKLKAIKEKAELEGRTTYTTSCKIKELYGERVQSRCLEMYNFVVLEHSGLSYRENKELIQ